MSILSTIKKVLGLQDELQTALGFTALLVQKIEDSTLTGPQKLAWVKEQLERYLPAVAPRIAKNWKVNWPKIDQYITVLVAVAKLAGLFVKAVR